jgi:hypothetical protein
MVKNLIWTFGLFFFLGGGGGVILDTYEFVNNDIFWFLVDSVVCCLFNISSSSTSQTKFPLYTIKLPR